MRRAAIVNPLRTPVGSYGGALRPLSVEALGATVVSAILQQTGLDPALVEDVIFAQAFPNGETPCVGRWIALEANLPIEVSGMHLDRRCGGGLQSIVTASMMIQTGVADVVLAGGVESMSNIEHYTTDVRWGKRAGSITLHDRIDRSRERSQPVHRFGHISGMIETAENLATEFQITREDADTFAVRSHMNAAAAWKENRFRDEIAPVSVAQRRGDPVIFDQDEGIRTDASLEAMAGLRPITRDGTVTPGNACQQSDAAAACLIVAEDRLQDLGLEPIGFLRGWAVTGCHPATMGIGPVPAIEKLLRQTGISMNQIDLVEINEAFACQVLAVLKGLDWHDEERLNVNGSGISLGHPAGCTGARIATTLLHELRRRGGRYGLESMCIGGGQGMAAIFEAAATAPS